jgi:transcriptional regulator with XRE-family HTH domain
MNIGINISKLRAGAGLTQEQVTAQMQIMGCNLSRSIYSQIECGTYNIRISELLAMKKIFKAEFEDFFEGLEI